MGLLKTANNAMNKGLKFGAATSLGIIGTGVGVGVSAKRSMDRGIDGFSSGLMHAIIMGSSLNDFERHMSMSGPGMHPHRRGFDMGMMAARGYGGPELG